MPNGKLQMVAHGDGEPHIVEMDRQSSYDQLVGMVKVLVAKLAPSGVPVLMTREELLRLNGMGMLFEYNVKSGDVTASIINPRPGRSDG